MNRRYKFTQSQILNAELFRQSVGGHLQLKMAVDRVLEGYEKRLSESR